MLAETDTIQARDDMSLAAVMMNMAGMCQGSVKRPLNQVCCMYAAIVDSGITNSCSRVELSFPVLQRLGTVQAILTLMQP